MLQGKVALVTGAASGIGRSIALAYAREGCRVVVSDVDSQGGEETLRQVQKAGGAAVFLAADVSQPEHGSTLVQHTVDAFGRLDIACNNAGIGGDLAPTADYPIDEWQRVIATNLSGVFYGMKYQLARMLGNGGGAIVNISSILGQVAFANAPAYTAAKHGVVGLTKAAALEYSSHGIRVNAVGPAFIHTPMISALEANETTRQAIVAMHPIGRLGRPEEVAELVVWLSSARASFVSGAYIPVDGAYLTR